MEIAAKIHPTIIRRSPQEIKDPLSGSEWQIFKNISTRGHEILSDLNSLITPGPDLESVVKGIHSKLDDLAESLEKGQEIGLHKKLTNNERRNLADLKRQIRETISSFFQNTTKEKLLTIKTIRPRLKPLLQALRSFIERKDFKINLKKSDRQTQIQLLTEPTPIIDSINSIEFYKTSQAIYQITIDPTLGLNTKFGQISELAEKILTRLKLNPGQIDSTHMRRACQNIKQSQNLLEDLANLGPEQVKTLESTSLLLKKIRHKLADFAEEKSLKTTSPKSKFVNLKGASRDELKYIISEIKLALRSNDYSGMLGTGLEYLTCFAKSLPAKYLPEFIIRLNSRYAQFVKKIKELQTAGRIEESNKLTSKKVALELTLAELIAKENFAELSNRGILQPQIKAKFSTKSVEHFLARIENNWKGVLPKPRKIGALKTHLESIYTKLKYTTEAVTSWPKILNTLLRKVTNLKTYLGRQTPVMDKEINLMPHLNLALSATVEAAKKHPLTSLSA